jgi:hypothetical protein
LLGSVAGRLLGRSGGRTGRVGRPRGAVWRCRVSPTPGYQEGNDQGTPMSLRHPGTRAFTSSTGDSNKCHCKLPPRRRRNRQVLVEHFLTSCDVPHRSALTRVTVHGFGGNIAIWRVSPPHNVADLSEFVTASSSAATLRGGGHAPTRERLPHEAPAFLRPGLAGGVIWNCFQNIALNVFGPFSVAASFTMSGRAPSHHWS